MVVLVLPPAQLGRKFRGRAERHAAVKLLLVRPMTAFHLAVHLRATRWDPAMSNPKIARAGT